MKWIQPQHLTSEATADYASNFRRDPEHLVVIDDFLDPVRLATIRRVLLSDGQLETVYKVRSKKDWVGEAEFNATSDDMRFIFEKMYRGPLPGKEMEPGILTDLMFRQLLRGSAFLSWLAAATGQPVHQTGEINLKLLNQSHFLRWHSDGVPNRTLCMVMYLHEGWRIDFAGRFLLRRFNGRIDSIEPICNRLILFDPQTGAEHAVEPISAVAGAWSRLNYTAWFYA